MYIYTYTYIYIYLFIYLLIEERVLILYGSNHYITPCARKTASF